jgi:hypothetical protein
MKGINSESDFENHIRDIIRQDILNNNSNLILLKNKKAVDILICRNNDNQSLFFIEIKYHKSKHGRLGFGHEKGGGIQPEILTKRPEFFETNLKWIIGSEESENYFLFNNAELVNYLKGGQISEKFNGIQKRIFKEATVVNKQELILKLGTWIDNNK